MTDDQKIAIETLVAKEAIRELVLLYARAADRQDIELLRTLYTHDATDSHGNTFDGDANAFIDFLAQSFPYLAYSGHHVCNHLISVQGGVAEGEVYALTYNAYADGQDGMTEDLMGVRYNDTYRRGEDNRWRFSKRVVTYDFRRKRPIAPEVLDSYPGNGNDPSYQALTHRLFQRGGRE